ncbi:hypothetical protein EHV15_29985 [Paenibacillus oralis]|uniref:DUF5668 domain-containing protein n=1 Tax=Paenibacillus oralis TaxID=2490856 RepID=A0A3P3UAW7_9BACL|nr:hypothetical protein [Paenibacillus oralis]RRJ66689.1 hypothetical protein EHV15_29985 [Paenibacillus oralis]
MDMSDNNKLMTGILILAAGIVILLGKLGFFSFLGRAFWPLLLLIPGILLHLWHFWRKGPSELLLPGAILVVYSIVFFIGIIGGWDTLKYTWPLFFLGIAVGLFEYDYFSPRRQNGMFIAALIIGAISVILLGWTLFSLSLIYVLAILLIIGGIWLIVVRGRGKNRSIW